MAVRLIRWSILPALTVIIVASSRPCTRKQTAFGIFLYMISFSSMGNFCGDTLSWMISGFTMTRMTQRAWNKEIAVIVRAHQRNPIRIRWSTKYISRVNLDSCSYKVPRWETNTSEEGGSVSVNQRGWYRIQSWRPLEGLKIDNWIIKEREQNPSGYMELIFRPVVLI